MIQTVRELGLTIVRIHMKTLDKDYTKTEDDMKALQSVGQIIGEVLKQLDHERCKSSARSKVGSERVMWVW